jgi:hypothetical protein
MNFIANLWSFYCPRIFVNENNVAAQIYALVHKIQVKYSTNKITHNQPTQDKNRDSFWHDDYTCYIEIAESYIETRIWYILINLSYL